ncbi:GyrI-like domain-containing protein [Virgibacillus flavescens]|uniref:GyrI-like domain-containing protein n=1 Tax=Virgibacillus flavescens TaxID=1611422 RepID=UPI003D341671
MSCQKVTKAFKIIGKKHSCAFGDYASEVPKHAQNFMEEATRIQNHTGIEVSLFEPKKDETHVEGIYYVGVLVSEPVEIAPEHMEYLEVEDEFVTIRGKMTNVSDLYSELLAWAEEQGYIINQNDYIVETYHPVEIGEEVEVYIPILSRGEEFNENRQVVS